jgi:hypothetical protein
MIAAADLINDNPEAVGFLTEEDKSKALGIILCLAHTHPKIVEPNHKDSLTQPLLCQQPCGEQQLRRSDHGMPKKKLKPSWLRPSRNKLNIATTLRSNQQQLRKTMIQDVCKCRPK